MEKIVNGNRKLGKLKVELRNINSRKFSFREKMCDGIIELRVNFGGNMEHS